MLLKITPTTFCVKRTTVLGNYNERLWEGAMRISLDTKWIFSLFLLFVSACSPTHDMTFVPINPNEVEVEIDVTSGVPSPKWLLNPEEVKAIEQALSALIPTESASFFDGLGYRGFVIQFKSPDRSVRVQNGYVLIEEKGLQKTYIDSNNQLEQWLLDASKPHIEPELYSFLEGGIGM